MKDDTSQEKKSQQQAEQKASDPHEPQYEPFQKDEEDVDFEILDALEQMEQTGNLEEESLSDDDTKIELTLEDEDILFEEDDESGESGFRFDESVAVDLEEELQEKAIEFSLDESLGDDFEEDVGEIAGEDSFSIDLDQEEDQEEMDLLFDSEEEIAGFDLDLSEEEEFSIEAETTVLDEEIEFDQPTGGIVSAEINTVIEEFDLGTDEELEEELALEPELPEIQENIDLEIKRVENMFDEMNIEDELPDLEEDIAVKSISGAELPEIDFGDEADEFQEDEDIEFEVEQDIDIDLEAEATKILEDQESVADIDFSEEEMSDFDLPEGIDVVSDEDVESEAEEAEEFPEEQPEDDISVETSQELPEEELEAYEMEEDMLSSEIGSEEEVGGEAEESAQPEVDERQFLGLTLRLDDVKMEQFEGMVTEAQTIQGYLEKLEAHKAEIKDKIYQKLCDEYVSRKTEIFSTPEFINIHTDVEQDLQDMLAKQTEFVTTVERLNEELEEITVRHLVGEYSNEMLSEKEKSQREEIDRWNEKTEKIEHVIHRFQSSLDLEQELNPLQKPQESGEEDFPEEPRVPTFSEQEEDFISSEEQVQEEEQISSSDYVSDEDVNLEEEMSDTGEFAEDMLFGSELPTDINLEEDVDLEELSRVAEEESEMSTDMSFDEEETAQGQEEMLACKKCGRQTPVSEKFCVHCGAKSR